MSARLPVYLAGPDVFLTNSAEIGRRKRAICEVHGLEGHYPGDGVDLATIPPADHGLALFESCVEMMDRCIAGLANLTPFRGPSADVGTAFEMGYLFGRGFPVFGYTSQLDDYATRVSDEARAVEDFGLADNLMLEGPMMRRELAVVRAAEPDGAGAATGAALAAFELAARLAAHELGTE